MAGLLATAALAAVIMISVKGDKGEGTVTIETVDPDVEVVLTGNGRTFTIKDKKTKQEITLPVGRYEIELKGGKDGLKLETSEFNVKRGKDVVVKVTWRAGKEPKKLEGDKAKVVPTGKPMSAMALVRKPAKIPGVESWSIETISHRGYQTCVLSPDGQRLATFGADGAIRVWDTRDGRLLRVFLGHHNGTPNPYWSPGQKLTWSPDGLRLASLDQSGNMRIWNVGTGQQLRTVTTGYGSCIAWSPDGKILATGGLWDALGLWDANTGEKIDSLKTLSALCLAWSPTGNQLALVNITSGEIWDTEKGEKLKALDAECAVGGLAWSHDGKRLAVGGWPKGKVFDVASGNLSYTIDGSGDPFFPKDGKTICYGNGVWDIASGKRLRPLQSERLLRLLPADDKIPSCIMNWSPNGYLVADHGYDRCKVWDATTGKVVSRLPEGVGGRNAWDFSPDGKSLAMAMFQGPLRIWDLASGRAKVVFANVEQAFEVKWSPDGKNLLVVNGDQHSHLFRDTIVAMCPALPVVARQSVLVPK